MSITISSVTNYSFQVLTSSTLTKSYTVSGSSSCLIVFAFGAYGTNVDSVTFGGTSMTQGCGGANYKMFYLLGATGTANIVITYNSGTEGACSFFYGNNVKGIGASNTSYSAGSPSTMGSSLTTTEINSRVVGFVSDDSNNGMNGSPYIGGGSLATPAAGFSVTDNGIISTISSVSNTLNLNGTPTMAQAGVLELLPLPDSGGLLSFF